MDNELLTETYVDNVTEKGDLITHAHSRPRGKLIAQ